MKELNIEEIEIRVEPKAIKNIYIRIVAPDGQVKLSVPKAMTQTEIRAFIFDHMDWIKSKREKYKATMEITKLKYESGEIVFIFGEPYRLEVQESFRTIRGKVILLKPSKGICGRLILMMPKGSRQEEREKVLKQYERRILMDAIPPILKKCEAVVGKQAAEWRIKEMKTRWGTCNIEEKRIWLSLQLSHKSPECLEYVITHELVHLYVRNHDAAFKAYMDVFYPNWREVKKKLNTPQ